MKTTLKFVATAAAALTLIAGLAGCASAQAVPKLAASATLPAAEMKNGMNLTDGVDVKVTGFRGGQGRELKLQLVSGDPKCYAVGNMELNETNTKVTVKLEVAKDPKATASCVESGVSSTFTILLKARLGDRTVDAY